MINRNTLPKKKLFESKRKDNLYRQLLQTVYYTKSDFNTIFNMPQR
jgi:hypothetical protein